MYPRPSPSTTLLERTTRLQRRRALWDALARAAAWRLTTVFAFVVCNITLGHARRRGIVSEDYYNGTSSARAGGRQQWPPFDRAYPTALLSGRAVTRCPRPCGWAAQSGVNTCPGSPSTRHHAHRRGGAARGAKTRDWARAAAKCRLLPPPPPPHVSYNNNIIRDKITSYNIM